MKTKLLIAILLLGWLCSGIASAQAPDTLFISTSQVAHLRFASELKYVNLGSRDIVAYREHPSRLEIDTRSAQSLPSFSPSNADGGPSAPRFAVESKRRTKRGLLYEKEQYRTNSPGLSRYRFP